MGFIDLVGIAEDDLCEIKYKLKNVNIKPNVGEDHSINVEIEVEIFCKVFGNKEISIIQDMYSPSRNLNINQNEVTTMINMKSTKTTVNIREKIKLEDQEYNKICDVLTDIAINDKNISRDMVKYSGDINLKIILLNNDETNTKTQEVSLPFSFSQEIEGIFGNDFRRELRSNQGL